MCVYIYAHADTQGAMDQKLLGFERPCLKKGSVWNKISSHLFKVLECEHIYKIDDPLLIQQHFECSPPPQKDIKNQNIQSTNLKNILMFLLIKNKNVTHHGFTNVSFFNIQILALPCFSKAQVTCGGEMAVLNLHHHPKLTLLQDTHD